MKRALIVTSLLVASTLTAFAGKEERDMMTKEVMPEVSRAETNFKASCGCPITITIDDTTVTTKDVMREAKHIAGHVADGVKGYCTDAASKKAVCQMTSLKIGKAPKATFSFKGGAGVATTDGQSNCTWDMMTRELDK